MSEEYLTLEETAERLKISKRSLDRRMTSLKRHGLKVVKLGHFPRVIASTIDKAMLRAATRENSLV